jgi:3-hydroxyisobutyrate dehydrogenase
MPVNPLKVGVVGLGQMGGGIARNLGAKGLLTAAFDSKPEAGADLAVPRLEARDMVQAVDVLFCVTPSCLQIADYLGDCETTDVTLIDLTTSDPKQSTALAEQLAPRGFHYIDAAMTGGAAGADAGTLTLMAGGDTDRVALCKPAIDVISSTFFHLGPIGSGHAMKLIHNLILHSAFMATCEGMRMAERAGLDLNEAVAVLNAGNARSFVTEVRFPRDILSGTLNGRSTISNLAKDLNLGVDYAQALGGPSPYGALTLSLLDAARDAGHAQTDFSNLFAMYESLADTVAEET